MSESTPEIPSLRRNGRNSLAAVGLGCSALLAGWLMLPLDGLLIVVGVLVCFLIGLVLLPTQHTTTRIELPGELDLPYQLACDAAIFARYRRATELLLKVSRHPDPIFRIIALEQLDELVRRLTSIAAGSLVFEETETWRIVYERLLRSPGLYLYRSVAWVRTADYWQDEPARKSMTVNYELQNSNQLNIERIAIIADELWPSTQLWPVEPLRQWLHEQYANGIAIEFVRESTLQQEPDLKADIGIYGSRALGTQELDDHSRTTRFVLTFDFTKVTEAEARWNRLMIYAESYGEYLDRYNRSR